MPTDNQKLFSHSDSVCNLRMDAKRWATFFVYLLSSSYVGTVVGQSRCQPNQKMEMMLNKCFENVRSQLADETFNLQDDNAGNLQMTGGTVSGLQNFRMTPPLQCSCNRDVVRIFIKLSFIDVTVTFVVTLLDDLLGGLLGNLGSSLARLVGQVVNLLVNLLALEINIVVTVEQRMIPGSTCTVSSFRVTRISEIKLLNLNLTQLLVGLLGDILTPVVETLLKNLLERQVRAIITREIQKLSFPPDSFRCS